MSQTSSSIPIFVYVLILVVGVKTFTPMFFNNQTVKGPSFSVQRPAGWTVTKDKHELTFTAPDVDPFTEIPEAIISIYAKKEQAALFMDDFFPEMLESLKRERGRILQSGTEKIDRQDAKWVMFRYNQPDIVVITLFIIDDYNRLTRIQLVTQAKKLKQYGEIFDKFKASIKLK